MTTRKPFSVHRVCAEEVIAGLPILQEYNSPLERVDVLILAAGFEPRVLAAPEKFISDGLIVSHAILVAKYATNDADNAERFGQLGPLLDKLGGAPTQFDAENPAEIGRIVSAAIEGVARDGPVYVTFDISGASSTLILSVMAALVQQVRRIHLTVIYATAAIYDSHVGSDGANHELRLESGVLREQGVSRVSHNELCAGLHHDHLPTMVIALPSMYSERLESCLSHLNVGPMTGSQDNLFWILPSTRAPEHIWRQQETRAAVEALVHKYQGQDASVPASGLLREDQVATCDVSSYQRCLALIVNQVDKYQSSNISVVHMGTKLQAIGVALAVAARQEVAVVTARPTTFNAKCYSTGIGALHQIVFEDLKGTVAHIAQIGCLSIDP